MPTQTIQVVTSQAFIDSAAKAFKEVVALRDANDKLLQERTLTTAERTSLETINAGLNEYLAIKDRTITATETLVKVYENIIRIQNDLIDKLENKLVKPKTIFDKIMDVIKTAGKVLAGIAIGKIL